jgi:hypothetical protein
VSLIYRGYLTLEAQFAGEEITGQNPKNIEIVISRRPFGKSNAGADEAR